MHKKQFYSLTILLCLLMPISIIANPISLTGKRYFNVSYGLSKQEKNNNEVINLDKKKEEVSDGLVNKPENN